MVIWADISAVEMGEPQRIHSQHYHHRRLPKATRNNPRPRSAGGAIRPPFKREHPKRSDVDYRNQIKKTPPAAISSLLNDLIDWKLKNYFRYENYQSVPNAECHVRSPNFTERFIVAPRLMILSSVALRADSVENDEKICLITRFAKCRGSYEQEHFPARTRRECIPVRSALSYTVCYRKMQR
jgi:hypothetical protein